MEKQRHEESSAEVNHVVTNVEKLSETKKQTQFFKYTNRIKLCNAHEFYDYIVRTVLTNSKLPKDLRRQAEIIKHAFIQSTQREGGSNTEEDSHKLSFRNFWRCKRGYVKSDKICVKPPPQKVTTKPPQSSPTRAQAAREQLIRDAILSRQPAPNAAAPSNDFDDDIFTPVKTSQFQPVKDADKDTEDVKKTIAVLLRYHRDDPVYFIPTSDTDMEILKWCLFYNFLDDHLVHGLPKFAIDLILSLLKDIHIKFPPLERFKSRIQRAFMTYESRDCETNTKKISKKYEIVKSKIYNEIDDVVRSQGDTVEVFVGKKWVPGIIMYYNTKDGASLKNKDDLTLIPVQIKGNKIVHVDFKKIRKNESEIIERNCKSFIQPKWFNLGGFEVSTCKRLFTKRLKYDDLFGRRGNCTKPNYTLRQRMPEEGGGTALAMTASITVFLIALSLSLFKRSARSTAKTFGLLAVLLLANAMYTPSSTTTPPPPPTRSIKPTKTRSSPSRTERTKRTTVKQTPASIIDSPTRRKTPRYSAKTEKYFKDRNYATSHYENFRKFYDNMDDTQREKYKDELKQKYLKSKEIYDKNRLIDKQKLQVDREEAVPQESSIEQFTTPAEEESKSEISPLLEDYKTPTQGSAK